MSTRKLGPCARCFDPTPSTTSMSLTFGGDTYKWELCEKHGDMLQRDIFSWTRCGTLEDERRTFKPISERRRGTVIAAHVHIPVARVEADPAPVPAPPKPQPPRADAQRLHVMELPPGYEDWSFTSHARERMSERKVRPELALWCAIRPQTSVPGNKEGLQVRTRGKYQVVVNPEERRIVTVIDLTLDSDKETELKYAAS